MFASTATAPHLTTTFALQRESFEQLKADLKVVIGLIPEELRAQAENSSLSFSCLALNDLGSEVLEKISLFQSGRHVIPDKLLYKIVASAELVSSFAQSVNSQIDQNTYPVEKPSNGLLHLVDTTREMLGSYLMFWEARGAKPSIETTKILRRFASNCLQLNVVGLS